MRRKKIGTMNFHGSVDVTDPCYDRDVWCRMNDVKIKQGEYDCYIWRHTDKGEYEDKTSFEYNVVGIIGIYHNGNNMFHVVHSLHENLYLAKKNNHPQ